MLTTLFLMQSVVPPDAPSLLPVPRCTATSADEVVVCGSRDNRKYRLDPLPDAKVGFGKAETMIGGANVAFVGEKGAIGGIPTNRAMVRIKIKF